MVVIYEGITNSKLNVQYAICIDSLSTLKAIQNSKNTNLYPQLRKQMFLELKSNTKLVWIPSHAKEAKYATTTAPLIMK